MLFRKNDPTLLGSQRICVRLGHNTAERASKPRAFYWNRFSNHMGNIYQTICKRSQNAEGLRLLHGFVCFDSDFNSLKLSEVVDYTDVRS